MGKSNGPEFLTVCPDHADIGFQRIPQLLCHQAPTCMTVIMGTCVFMYLHKLYKLMEKVCRAHSSEGQALANSLA